MKVLIKLKFESCSFEFFLEKYIFRYALNTRSIVCPHKSNPLVLPKKKNSKDYAIRNETITIVHFLLSSCDMSLHGKLVAVASRWLLKLFFLKSNDVLDAVLGTDLGEQRCFKFLIRQFVSLNKTKIICSMTDRKLSLPVVSVV